jgi:flagellin-like hook-associated protein FlgL
MNEINPYNGSISNLVGVQQNLVEKTSQSLDIVNISNDDSNLNIGLDLPFQKSNLSQSLSTYNNAIATTSIAQIGLEKQKAILENIRIESLKVNDDTLSDSDKNLIAGNINALIDQYDQVTYNTNFRGQQLLTTNGDETDDLSIIDDEDFIEIEKVDTASISGELKSQIKSLTPDNLDTFMNYLEDGINTLGDFQDRFKDAQESLIDNGKKNLENQTNAAKENSTVANIDYAQESADFNNTNLLSQMTGIIFTQSNAIQNRTVDLLSK